MPASSKSQQRLMGWVYACKTGKSKTCPKNIKKVAKGISTKDAKDFAKTKHKGLKEMENKMSLRDFLKEMGNDDSAWGLGGDLPPDVRKKVSPEESNQMDADRRQRLGSEIRPRTGDLIQTPNSNYIVLDNNEQGLKLQEIKTNKVGNMPNTFKFEKTGVAPNGKNIFTVSK